MDQYTKARTANYFNRLLMSGSKEDFEKLLRKYSIYTGDGVGRYVGRSIGAQHDITVGAANPNAALSGAGTNTIEFGKIDKGHKVAWVNLGLSTRQQASTTARGDRLEMEKTYAQRNGWVPAYFLPWSDLHAIRLTIPPMGHRSAKGEPDPDIFFTAAISGCSVIFQGTAQNPTIYHCGGPTGFGKNQLDEAAAFWEAVVDEFIQTEQTQGNSKGVNVNRGAVQATVDKRDYVTDGTTAVSKLGGTKFKTGTTFRAKKYAAELKRKHLLGSTTVVDVAPWGCVLGRRAANGDWTFYLQENADVIYSSIVKTPGGPKVTKQTTVSRPMVYREIFPSGPKHAALTAALPKLI